jgi:hypothetical protein
MFKEKEIVEENFCISKLLLICFEHKEMISICKVDEPEAIWTSAIIKAEIQHDLIYIYVKCKM